MISCQMINRRKSGCHAINEEPWVFSRGRARKRRMRVAEETEAGICLNEHDKTHATQKKQDEGSRRGAKTKKDTVNEDQMQDSRVCARHWRPIVPTGLRPTHACAATMSRAWSSTLVSGRGPVKLLAFLWNVPGWCWCILHKRLAEKKNVGSCMQSWRQGGMPMPLAWWHSSLTSFSCPRRCANVILPHCSSSGCFQCFTYIYIYLSLCISLSLSLYLYFSRSFLSVSFCFFFVFSLSLCFPLHLGLSSGTLSTSAPQKPSLLG